MSELGDLILMVYQKNELNLRRRRFLTWHYKWYKLQRFLWMKPHQRTQFLEYNKLSPIPITLHHSFVSDGYIKAKKDMKAMTAEMRTLRKKCGVRFKWDDSGFIAAVQLADGRLISRHDIKRYMLTDILFEREVLT